jgi:hypothetical protein
VSSGGVAYRPPSANRPRRLPALFQKSFYLVAISHLIVHASYTTWGWTHLIIGAIVLVGFGC